MLSPLLLENAPSDAQLITSWLRQLRAENKSPRTLAHYEMVVEKFAVFRGPGLNKATKRNVEDWLIALQDDLKPTSVNSYFRALRVFYKWMVDEEEIAKSPLDRIKEPSFEETEKDIVEPEGMAKVLAYLEKAKRWRDCAIIAVIYDTGLRAGEVANILVEHISLETGYIFIPHTKPKRTKTVHISARAIRYIDRYWRQPRAAREYVFSGRAEPLKRSGILRLIKKAFQEAGVPGVIGTHDLRHTSASHQVEQLTESEMMALFGWTSPAMVRHYAQKAVNRAALRAHERSSPLDRLPRPQR